MWIHLLRHGIAFDREDPRCPPDPQRPLTDKGVARTRAVATGLRRIGLEIDAILTSPYLRARQTADIIHDALAPEVPLKQVSSLVPDGDPATMLKTIAARKFDAPLCVGHSPSLDALVSYVVGCDGPVVRLKKAGLCSLFIERAARGGGRLHAALPPGMLRGLGR